MKPTQESSVPRLLTPPNLHGLLKSLEENIAAQEQSLAAARDALAKKSGELIRAQESGSAKPATGAGMDDLIDGFREPFARSMADIGVAVWRIRQSVERMEESKETRRIQRDLANCTEALKALGVLIVDRSNADLTNGIYRDIEVVTNEVSPEVTAVTVSEVLKPAVHFSVKHDLLRKDRERVDQPPFIIQKCQLVIKSPPPPSS